LPSRKSAKHNRYLSHPNRDDNARSQLCVGESAMEAATLTRRS